MTRQFWLSVVVAFIVTMACAFVSHSLLLGPDYLRLAAMFRTPEDSANYFVYMLLAHVALAVAFVWIYGQGRTDKPFLGQGVRFGLAVALLTAVPTYLIYYAVQPMPGMVVVKQIIFDTISLVIMGVVAARMNR